MPLKLLPAEATDMYRSAYIQREAFSPLASTPILFPGPMPSDVLDRRAEELIEEAMDPKTFWFKVVDTELEDREQAIAFAKWVIHGGSEPPKPSKATGLPSGSNVEACGLVFGDVAKLRPRHMGYRPHVFLANLYTDPKHQGRGAAGVLIQRFIEDAKAKGLPAYLDSSEGAHKLYLKYEFRDVEELLTDLSKWGLEEPHRVWAMVREP